MARKPVGEMVVSLDLETTAYTNAKKKILAESKEAAATINSNFQRLGVTSDEIYTAMATRAELAFSKIGLSAKASLAEVERSYAAMVTSINVANQKMNANPLFETLGIRSMAAIEAQKASVIASFDAIKTIGFKNDQERINAERAKNEQLKTLNKEMVGDHEMSMASMTRAVLRFYAAYYVISNVGRVVAEFFMSGVETIDKMQMSAIAVAATITNIQGTSGNIVENYKKNLAYAKELVPVLMQIDANSFMNLEQVMLVNNAMARNGVILDGNNKKQVETTTALTNAIYIAWGGQRIEIESTKETNALLLGQVSSRNRVAMAIDQAIKREGVYKGGLKELNAEAQKHNDWLARIEPYLVGYAAATGDVNKMWEATKSSLQTTWMILQQGLFKDVYKDLIAEGQKANTWIRANTGEIVKSINNIMAMLKFAIEATIVFFGLWAIAAVSAAIKAGTALDWFLLKWDIMSAKVTLASSKMALGFGVFTAAIAGWEIGTILNKFEEVRMAGISMVYGIIDVWSIFAKGFKEDLEQIAYAAKVADIYLNSTFADQDANLASAKRKHEAKLAWIKEEYDTEKKQRDLFRKEQEKDNTDAAMKAKADAQGKTPSPTVPPPKGETNAGTAFKQAKDNLESMKKMDKAYYDEKINEAENTAKLAQRAGQDEYKTIQELYNSKEVWLLRYENDQRVAAFEEVKIQAEEVAKSNATAKDGHKQTFDSAKVLQDKLLAISAVTQKSMTKLEGERKIANEDAAQKTLATMSNLYKSLGDLSSQSLAVQILEIEQKYQKEMQNASHTKEQIVLLEKARDNEIFTLRNAAEKKMLDMQLSYLKIVQGETSTQYKELNDLAIKNQVDLMERQFNNSKGPQTNKEIIAAEKLTSDLQKEYVKRLEDRAIYLKGMGDNEGADKATEAAKQISLRQIQFANQTKDAELLATNIVFDKKAVTEALMNEAKQKSLQLEIDYYSQISGFEEIVYNKTIEKIELEKKARLVARETEKNAIIELGNQGKKTAAEVAAANAKADLLIRTTNAETTQKKHKALDDEITKIGNNYDTEYKYQKETITNAIAVFDNASALMDKESKGYQIMQDAKKAAQIAEQLMIVQKNLAILAGIPATAAATQAEAGLAITTGATATLNAGASGDAYTAFARVAAMMAIVAAVLSAAGIAKGANSASAGSSASAPTYTGQTTVLGAADNTGSQSIENSYKMLQNIYSVEDTKLTSIYYELQDLNNNITGLVTSIVRTGGVTSTNVLSGTQYPSSWGQVVTDNNFTGFKALDTVLGWVQDLGLSIMNSVLGGEVTQELVAQGISVGDTMVSSILKGASVSAQQYALIRTTTSGGLFEGDDVYGSKVYSALNSNVNTMLTLVFKNLGSTLITLSKELGTDTNAVLNYVFKATELNLQGMTTDQMNKALQEYISNISDTAVETLFGSMLKEYQKLNEGLLETAIRLVTDRETIAHYLEMTNQKFNGTIPAAIKFSETLVTIAGGLDKITSAMQSYYDAFFNDTEKQAILKTQLTETLSQYGMSLPSTRAGYRTLVESQDLTTATGAADYTELMLLAKTADQYYQYIEAVTSAIKPENYSTNIAYQRALAGLPSYADGGYASGGYAIVGESGPELLNFKSSARVVSNKDSKDILSSKEIVAAIQSLQKEVANGNNLSNEVVKRIKKWDGDGLPTDRGF